MNPSEYEHNYRAPKFSDLTDYERLLLTELWILTDQAKSQFEAGARYATFNRQTMEFAFRVANNFPKE